SPSGRTDIAFRQPAAVAESAASTLAYTRCMASSGIGGASRAACALEARLAHSSRNCEYSRAPAVCVASPSCVVTADHAAPPRPAAQWTIWPLSAGGYRRAVLAIPAFVTLDLVVPDATGAGDCGAWVAAVGVPPPLAPAAGRVWPLGEENAASDAPVTIAHRPTAAAASRTRCDPLPVTRRIQARPARRPSRGLGGTCRPFVMPCL